LGKQDNPIKDLAFKGIVSALLNKNIRLRVGEMVTHWAHNPKIAGSIPAPATNLTFLE